MVNGVWNTYRTDNKTTSWKNEEEGLDMKIDKRTVLDFRAETHTNMNAQLGNYGENATV